MPEELKTETVIIGAGISGLAAGYYLQKAGKTDFLILEASPRAGGNIQTQTLDSFLIDAGPDSFLTTKPWAEELCREIGLEKDFISPQTQRVYIVREGQLRALPTGMMLGFPRKITPFLFNQVIPFSLKVRALREFLFPPKQLSPTDDESISEFVRRHFGQQAVDLLAEPILGGIYAASTQEMSLLATFPMLRDLEIKHRSIIRGLRASQRSKPNPAKAIFLSLKNGLGSLIEALCQRLPEESLRLNTVVKEIAKLSQKKGYRVRLESGQLIQTQHLILTLPPPRAAGIFESDSPLKAAFDAFPFASTATVFLAYPRKAIPHALDGLGFVCPRGGKNKILASTWISSKFSGRAPADQFLLRCFLGGQGQENLVDLSEDEILVLCHSEIERIMSINCLPTFNRVYRWQKSSPQYSLGHEQRLANLKNALAKYPNLDVIGNAYHGVGIPDCIRLAKEATTRLLGR